MQKARRHHIAWLRPLVGVRFQVLFTRVLPVLFTFPSQYLFTIGLSGVFSLGRWYCRIQREFLWFPPTQDTARPVSFTLTWLSHSVADLPMSFKFKNFPKCSPITPKLP